MRHEFSRRTALLAAGVMLGLALATTADAAQDEKKAKKGKPQQVVPTGAEDAAAAPVTAAEAQGEADLARMLDRTTEGLRSFQLPDGTVAVDLEGRFMHASVATKRPDGSVAVSCGASHKELAQAKAAASKARKPAAPVVLEEK